MRTFALFGAKHFGIFEIYGVSKHTRTCGGEGGKRLSHCGHFAHKGEGVNFSRFCADVLHGRPFIYIITSTLV